jgi:hypothetical protein
MRWGVTPPLWVANRGDRTAWQTILDVLRVLAGYYQPPAFGRSGCLVSLARRKTAGRMDGAKHYLVLLGSAALKEVSDERRH